MIISVKIIFLEVFQCSIFYTSGVENLNLKLPLESVSLETLISIRGYLGMVLLFPLDSRGWFGGYIVYYPVDAFDFVDDAI